MAEYENTILPRIRSAAGLSERGVPESGTEYGLLPLPYMSAWEALRRAGRGVEFGDIGFQHDPFRVTGSATTMVPLLGRPMYLGMRGYFEPRTREAGISGLEATYPMRKNRFLQLRYDPLTKSWGLQFGGRLDR